MAKRNALRSRANLPVQASQAPASGTILVQRAPACGGRAGRLGKAVRFRNPESSPDRIRFSDRFFDLDQSARIWAVVHALIDGLDLPEAAAYSGFLRRHVRKTQPHIPGL